MNQTSCLVNDDGWKNMDVFDYLPPDIRQLIRDSKYNLCPECFRMYLNYYKPRQAIYEMENDIYLGASEPSWYRRNKYDRYVVAPIWIQRY